MDAGRGTYLDVKASRDSTLGVESAFAGLKRKSSEILLFRVFGRKKKLPSKLLGRLKNDWKLSRR